MHSSGEDRSLSYLIEHTRRYSSARERLFLDHYIFRGETRLDPSPLFFSSRVIIGWPIVGCRYKDNRAYPWPGGESHFILYPESANQTIYAQKVRASDAGRYSCQARNDTTILEGDITLAVLGSYIVTFLKQYPALFRIKI